MKILICMRYANHDSGGAEKSMLTLSKMLKEDGHEIKIISLGYKNKKTTYENMPLREIKFRPYIINEIISIKEIEKFVKITALNLGIENEIKEFSPDIIFTQHEISFFIMNLKIQKKIKCPYYLFIHGFEYMRPTQRVHYWEQNTKNKISREILGEATENLLKKLIKNSQGVFFPSRYLMNLYQHLKANSSYYMIHPFIKIDNFLIPTNKKKRKFILHINPSINKGIEITLDIARKLRKEKFLIVGNKPNQKVLNEINKLNNVYYKKYQRDIRKTYRIAKVLIIPSIQPETYSLTSIEAQVNGCNLVASKNGGINAPNESFVKNIRNIDEWIKVIKIGGAKLKTSELKKFDARNQLKKLNKIVDLKNEEI